MERINLTLDTDTAKTLAQHARKHGRPRAAMARELIEEALARRAAEERRRALAVDYAEGRADAVEILEDMSDLQLEALERGAPDGA